MTQICLIVARPLVRCCDSRFLLDSNEAIIKRDYLHYLDRWVATTIWNPPLLADGLTSEPTYQIADNKVNWISWLVYNVSGLLFCFGFPAELVRLFVVAVLWLDAIIEFLLQYFWRLISKDLVEVWTISHNNLLSMIFKRLIFIIGLMQHFIQLGH